MTSGERHALSDEVERFLSDLVHDLRNLLDGVAMTLLQDSGPASDRDLQEIAFRNVYDVLRKTEDFRDRARPLRSIDGQSEARPVMERTLKSLRPFLIQRNVTLTADNGVWAAVDGRALTRILENIVHVLAKHGSQGDALGTSVAKRDDAIFFTFEIAAPAVPKTSAVFDELFSPDFKGGLDLWMSREAVRSRGGDLACTTEGDLLRLVLTLPAAEGPPEERAGMAKRRVLIVDDNLDGAKSLAVVLSSAGFETEVCRDGASALETASAFEPDAVLLDLGLPDMNGYDVCRRIRKTPGGERVLVLALTGRGDDETLASVRKAGFDAHFLKPVDRKRLIRRLCESD